MQPKEKLAQKSNPHSQTQYCVIPEKLATAQAQKGVNLPRYSHSIGVSVMGSHLLHQFLGPNCSPVIPLVEQAQRKLAELCAMRKPSLP